MVHAVEDVNGHALEDEIAFGRLFLKGLRDVGSRAQFFRQGVSDVRQRVAGPAGHNECAFCKKCFALVPLGNLAKRIDTDQEKNLVDLFQRLFQAANRIDGVVGVGDCTRFRLRRGGSRVFGGRLEQRWDKRFLGCGGQCDHRVALRERG